MPGPECVTRGIALDKAGSARQSPFGWTDSRRKERLVDGKYVAIHRSIDVDRGREAGRIDIKNEMAQSMTAMSAAATWIAMCLRRLRRMGAIQTLDYVHFIERLA